MYSVFFSKIELGIDCIKDRLQEIITEESKVVILPWAFSVEINSEILLNDYFKVGEKRYLRYVNALKKIGIKEENILICDCYCAENLKSIIKESDMIVIPGGNPEMLFQKIVHDTELLYDLKYYKKIILGESAGALLQFKRYFITAKNNFYKYFAYYDGCGIINNSFYLDVHSSNNPFYVKKLREVAIEKSCPVYAIFDDGAILYQRESKEIETYGHVMVYENKNG